MVDLEERLRKELSALQEEEVQSLHAYEAHVQNLTNMKAHVVVFVVDCNSVGTGGRDVTLT